MYKYIFSILALIFVLAAAAQNVGIGTETPMQKLDVNGNINMQGSLHVNNNAGRPGQVLRVNSDGTQNWANAFGYKNRVEYIGSATYSFYVPNNIREIMIEAVGGGGGGAKGGGGASGDYTIGIYKVAPGQGLTINVGNGGAGAIAENDLGLDGQATTVTSFLNTSIDIFVQGGKAAYSNSPGEASQFFSFIQGDSVIFAKTMKGSRGAPTYETYSQYNSTTFLPAVIMVPEVFLHICLDIFPMAVSCPLTPQLYSISS